MVLWWNLLGICSWNVTFITSLLALGPFVFGQNWDDYLRGILMAANIKGWRLKMATLFLNIMVYQIGRERNHRLHNQGGHSDHVHVF